MIYLVTNQVVLFEEFKIISLSEALILLNNIFIVGVDTETEGLDRFTKKILSIQLGNKDFQVVIDLASYGGILPQSIIDYLHSNRLFIFQNAKFDLQFLYMFHCIPTKVYDTYLVEIILTNGLQYDGRALDALVSKYCPDGYMDKSIRGQILKYGLTPDVIKYAANDIVYLEDIMNKQMKNAKFLHMENAINIDNSFVKVLAYIEFCGIKLDVDKWNLKCVNDTEKLLANRHTINDWLLENNYDSYFGTLDMFTSKPECIINWDSPKQVIELFEKLGISCDKIDKGVKKKSVDAKTIEPQKNDFPIIPIYLNYKETQKLVSTYGVGWFKHISKVTGRIHTRFNQLMDTGRLSCGGKDKATGTQWPNLQNLPSDKLTRSCFIPENGHSYICADFSGQEQIVLANFCQDPALIAFYKKGFSDMHSYVALLMYENIRKDLGINDIIDITNDHLIIVKKKYSKFRTIAKSAGFAINYGGNGSTIAKNCQISKADGDFVYNTYFQAFSGLKNYFDACFDMCDKYQYLEYSPVTGRKYFFSFDNQYFQNKDIINDYGFRYNRNARQIQSDSDKAKNEIQRLSQNYRIQGTSADITKIAGIKIMKALIDKNLLWIVKIVNVIHDEFIVECPDDLVDVVSDIVITSMRDAGKPFCKIIPLDASLDVGKYWIH